MPRKTPADQMKLLTTTAVYIMASVLMVHAFSPAGLSVSEFVTHFFTVWFGFLIGMGLAAWLIVKIPGSAASQPTVRLLWIVSATGFVFGILVTGALDRFDVLSTAAEKASFLHGPRSMLLRLIPVWVLVTAYLVRNEILRSYEARFAAIGKSSSLRPSNSEVQPRIRLGSGKSAPSVSIASILLVSAEENYCRITIRKNGVASSNLVRTTLQAFISGLPSSDFIRVHRSYIVNGNRVKRIKRHGRQFFIMLEKVEEEIPVSRRRLREVVEFLERMGRLNL
jgi:hypothetical protein